jgi:hypothetical protein
MADSTASLNPLDSLPPWARELSEKYYSRTFALFLLHGNVRDLVPVKKGPVTEFLLLPAFLEQHLFGRRDIVIHYDRGGGLKFSNPAAQTDFRAALSAYDSFHDTKYSQSLPRNVDGVLMILEAYIRLRLTDGN